MSVYGYCPVCGAPGYSREKRPGGNDTCVNGHKYPSSSAKPNLPTDSSGSKEEETSLAAVLLCLG